MEGNFGRLISTKVFFDNPFDKGDKKAQSIADKMVFRILGGAFKRQITRNWDQRKPAEKWKCLVDG